MGEASESYRRKFYTREIVHFSVGARAYRAKFFDDGKIQISERDRDTKFWTPVKQDPNMQELINEAKNRAQVAQAG